LTRFVGGSKRTLELSQDLPGGRDDTIAAAFELPMHPVSACLKTLILLLIPASTALAAPFVPASDAQVLERLPARATDPRARELLQLRNAWRRDPGNLDAAVQLARRYFEEVAAEGDPRYIGYAQAALQPWWDQPEPPPSVRVMRALVLQFDHRFAPALADLAGAVQVEPDNAEAWSWQAAIHMVQADYPAARRACDRLAPLAPALIGVACTAYVDASTGRAAQASTALRQALQRQPDADPAERLWSLTRLAEIDERRGDFAAAEASFRAALALGRNDVYLLAAYADFLLDRNRPAEVLTLLKDKGRADVLLLRLAIAAKAASDPAAANHARDLGARFDAARMRGDTSHRKEQSRFTLAVLGQPAAALDLARDNYAQQREPADARLLLEAALAARQPAAAEPVLKWLAESGIESLVLQALAAQLKNQR